MQRIVDKLIAMSYNSDVLQRHSAVLLKNGKAISWGINYISGNDTIHAELCAIRRYLSIRGQHGYLEKGSLFRQG